ncbi:tRNA lysidine(34) synthetase TilS [Brachyspira hyodysenteriae]|uniref:tRNA lysidine(34) synthetase TilS n=1 Tax=Brachyspira hyodysenteriae TaxID=159 RepID=UPI000A14A9EE|nr:tRNA lysidine(34) synthetase TilS [Brachyspira hyodysenteriae]MCZ9919244.1 tRNA lysidine(34) synthetase TilS [Brachyspira hyodysenteriae]MCZ9963958.1 tRNA lysidine(34) synthetase TilS [Brachyspira hyodysenteriae]MDA0023398.1 tRNA lysidine(34) synthetase TilS [Brachyspira hyodysenteriae]MDA0157117.1 tRNA lysidine(34) synthetase TilS [Brachyspira hyodysenteriae]QTM03127.1 tRNA lysidine(34) synthetase TilS [Brachyspira hyodysenteriae]
MLKETYNFLISNIEDIKNKTLAVAYSGGIDSQVLLNIAYRLKDELSFDLIIIHVNYNLRGEDSTNDELFARDMAKKYNIEIYVKEIKPNSYNGKNIQLEARNDRYNFFEELHNKKIYDYLLIAHNKDDLAETIIYRMIKGAGTNVYKSLRDKKGYILRPILNFYRKDIEAYARNNNLEHREDVSNKKNYYSRNKIRNLIIPMLEEINTNAKNNIIRFAKRSYEETYILRKKINKLYKKNIYKKNTKLNIEKIKNTNELFIKKIIVKFLAKNNIEITEKRVSEILKVIKSDKPNIKLRLDNFYLIKEYNYINIKAIEKKLDNTKTNNFIRIEKDGIYNFLNKKIEIKTVLNKNINYKDNIYIKADYPLIIRNKKESDFINAYPNGNKKYLRKILIDLKIPLYERERVPIITSENDDILALYLEPYGLNRISKNAAVSKDDEYILEINVYYDKE